MRPALLLCFSAVLGHAASAQLSIVPQLGLETSRTAIAFNKQGLTAPLGAKLSPQAAVRLAYAFKKAHGPFVGLATSRSVINYAFSNPETGATAFTAARGGTQLRLEGGYQLSTKPLYFKKAPTARTTASQYQKSSSQSGCSKSVARSSCGSKSSKATAAKPIDTRSWVRVQPSVGVAYIPGGPQEAIYKNEQANYAYNAGNWTTGLVSGVGFEFGKGKQARYNISLNYIKGLGNLQEQTLTTQVDNKPITTTMKSTASAWNLRMGFPISFAKKQATVKQPAVPKMENTQKQRCGQYKTQYKSRCTRTL